MSGARRHSQGWGDGRTPLLVQDLEVHVLVRRAGREAQQAGAAVLVRIGVALQQVLRRLRAGGAPVAGGGLPGRRA